MKQYTGNTSRENYSLAIHIGRLFILNKWVKSFKMENVYQLRIYGRAINANLSFGEKQEAKGEIL